MGHPDPEIVQVGHMLHLLQQTDLFVAVASPTASSINIAGQLPSVTSTRSVRRRLLVDFQLASRRPAKQAKLSAKDIKDRVVFCRKYRMWRKEDWMKLCFRMNQHFRNLLLLSLSGDQKINVT